MTPGERQAVIDRCLSCCSACDYIRLRSMRRYWRWLETKSWCRYVSPQARVFPIRASPESSAFNHRYGAILSTAASGHHRARTTPANTDPLANRISTASLVLGRPRNSILQPDGLLSSSTRLEAFASSYQSSGIHPDEMCTRFHITAANRSRHPGRQVS